MDLTPPQLDLLHEGYKSLTSPPQGAGRSAGGSGAATISRRKRGETK